MEQLIAELKRQVKVDKISTAGSVRRMKETVGDADIVAASQIPEPVMEAFVSHRMVSEVLARGSTKSSIRTREDLQIDLRVVPPDVFGAALMHFTGSRSHNIRLREMAVRNGIRINEYGQVANFSVSEKCAAGSGRFIDVIAHVLRVELKDFGALSSRSKHPVTFSTGCAVFGESEAITRVSEGFAVEDIAAGVNIALAVKISAMASKMGIEEPCAVCGGGALNSGLIQALKEEMKCDLLVPPQPQMTAALGAAVIARRLHAESSSA